MEGLFSQTTDAFALKLHTLIGHHQMTLRASPKTLYQILTQLCPSLDINILVKVLHARYYHGHISLTTYDFDLKLHSCLQGYQTVNLGNSCMDSVHIMARV